MYDCTKEQLLARTGFTLGNSPNQVPRTPPFSKKSGIIDCHILVEKITQSIKVTYSQHLSYVVRLQVINAVLFSIHNFWGTLFIFPQSILKEVDKICGEYLW